MNKSFAVQAVDNFLYMCRVLGLFSKKSDLEALAACDDAVEMGWPTVPYHKHENI